ncbi:two-component regulator propeller domain-containing protein [Hymenobacter crusticola]|uniref:histidine kinase n=1 Tax=Hymenobacter crusticola TaxID=1770526 RepID=A0A243W5L0_9BACT|nr:two-component regulator propeller domain-containing protein [Hymenobacter crusticola]OUJ68720.1 hypothetical protein BXP70_27515 [Hymenobacter crusticola]
MKFLYTVACWLLFALLPHCAAAQPPPVAWRFDHLTVSEGLAHSDGMTVAQDRLGFMWVGTNRGLDRYDGQHIQHFLAQPDKPGSLSSNRIRKVYVAPSGDLWVGTENAGLNYFDRQKEQAIYLTEVLFPPSCRAAARQLAKAYITSMATDRLGRLWVGTEKAGLFVVERGLQGRFTGLRRIRGAGLPLEYEVSDVQASKAGIIWVGTSRGLYSANGSVAEPVLRVAALPTHAIQTLHLDRQDNLWVGAQNQVFCWQALPATAQAALMPTKPLGNVFPGLSSLLLDSFGRLWVGTEFGIFIVHPSATQALNSAAPAKDSVIERLRRGKVEHLVPEDGVPTSLTSGRVHQLLEDRFQVVWIGTSAGGVNKVDLLAKPFGHLSRQVNGRPSLPSNYVNAIYKEETRNLLWIGTRNGFSKYNPVTHTYQNYLSKAADGEGVQVDVSTIFQDSRGTLWFGTWHDGIVCLRRRAGREQLTRLTARPGQKGLSSNMVMGFAEDRAGFIWVSTYDAGLCQFTPEGVFVKAYSQQADHLPTNSFCTLYYDGAANVLWATSHDAGLLKLQPAVNSLRVLNNYTKQPGNLNSLSVNYVCPLLPDQRGNLWLGSIGGGLHQFQPRTDSMRRYQRWVPESDVESMLEDEQGRLWIGGGGLLRFDPRTRQCLRFDAADGLQSNSFKVGAAHRAQDGTLYFGGINGINYFQPSAICPNPYSPTVAITALRVLNRSVAIGDTLNGRVLLAQSLLTTPEITIKAQENDFSLDFVGLHYANPGKNTYAYQLVGYHAGWVTPPPGQRTANFTNLAPGNYTFRVKASNGDGRWSRHPAELRIVVLPPWWKTWGAYTLYGVAVVGALLAFRRVSAAQQQLKNKLALEQLAHEKDRELNELKLHFFTNVSHELRTPLTLIMGPMEELVSLPGKPGGMRDKLLLVHRQTRKLLNLVNQLLDFRKAEATQPTLRAQEDDLVAFTQEVFLIFQAKALETKLDYQFEAVPAAIPLYFDRSKLEIVLSNLLSNALKYTPPGGSIRMSLTVVGSSNEPAQYANGSLQDNYVQLQVRDSGSGMQPTELDRIFDVYYQASHTDTMQVMGTGIGLALVKQLIGSHRGDIAVHSRPGEGTLFCIRLPLGLAHLRPEEIQPATTPVAYDELPLLGAELPTALAEVRPMGTGPARIARKLLLVEDNEEVLGYLCQLFEPLYDVQVARNGLEGWAIARSFSPDLLISDVMMPESDGLALCRKVKQHAQTMHIPVLLLTARTAAMQQLEGLETGADDYVSKPFHPELLQAKVANMLNRRQQMQEYYQRQILLEPTAITLPDEDRALLEKAMAIVEQHLEEPEFNVQVLVREIGLSQSLLYRRIKTITGQTVIEFIQDVRMRRAAQLLRESSLRISEVAYKVGIENLKRFRSTFQKMHQMSPQEYAKKHRGIELEEPAE